MPKSTDIVADTLIEAGIDHVFGMPGGAMIFFYNSILERSDKIRSVLARQEGAASCMADMYGRLTGRPAAVVGQGAWIGSNAAFGIMEAYLAGSPMLIITDTSDYANLSLHGPYQNATGDYGAFDLPSIMRSMTKFTTVATNASEFIHGVRLAVKHSITGKPGPTAVICRWNAVGEEIEPGSVTPKLFPLKGHLNVSPPSISDEDADKVADILIGAKNPVIIAGRGIHAAKAYDQLLELSETLGIPVATSYMGKSGIPETHDLALGTMGIVGQRAANGRIAGADVILAVGTCLAPENTKMLATDFINPEKQKIVQIDIEPLNVAWTYPVNVGITSDARFALSKIVEKIRENGAKIDVAKRIEEVKKFKSENGYFAHDLLTSEETPISPARVVNDVDKLVKEDDIVVLDTGNNRIFFKKLLKSKRAGQVFAGGGVAGMGWGIPAALAAQMLNPKRRVICGTGDGCMMMMLHCLETASQYELPVNLVVLNNSLLGNINDFMGQNKELITEYPEVDLSSTAKSMGCVGIKVKEPKDLEPALKEAFESDRPALVDVTTARTPHFTMM
ncbi:MAG: thiamine pyrophosphate-binding protein [Deltaproteobacteria bacterium]|uniref:Thiamine pyrophosphate-binding protein n=1 Tax=Candidatus Zymogenus saltonus TaxID=2844893 RepID=A0A9D8KED8_9DELT|nr:thiamine pyrophosphate-binding protein [Candidatus Zymogenus saltonus]